MYYEEKIINGILHVRSTPTGKWIKLSKKQLTAKLVNKELSFKKIISDTLQMSDSRNKTISYLLKCIENNIVPELEIVKEFINTKL